RSEGRGGDGAEGGEIVLFQHRRGVRHPDSEGGNGGAAGAAGVEGRGNLGRGRRQRDGRADSGAADAAGRRLLAGAGAELESNRGRTQFSASPALSLQVRIRGA